MEINIKKQKLRTALAIVRKAYYDSIAESIVNEPQKTYGVIAQEHGVSRQFVLGVAKARHIGRNEDMDEVIVNG